MWTEQVKQIENLRMNNYRKDVLKLDTIPSDQHFAKKDHNFNTRTKFTIAEQLQTEY